MTAIALLLLLVALMILVVIQRQRATLLQYIYLVRFPLLFAIALIALPPAALWAAPEMLRNLFVLGAVWELALVITLAILAAWVVMYTLFLVLRSMGNVYPELAETALHTWWGRRRPWLLQHRAWLFGLLALPTAATAVWLSQSLGYLACLLGVLAGVGTTVVLWFAMWGLHKPAYGLLGWTRRRIRGLLRRVPAWAQVGYEDTQNDIFRHDAALALLAITATVYFLVYLMLRPGASWFTGFQLPAVAYLFLLLIVWCWLLPAAAFALDRHRVSIWLLIAMLSFGLYTVFDTDHYYSVVPLIEEVGENNARAVPSVEQLDPKRAFEAWRREKPMQKYATPVVVFGSGGGARAALWTAKVLTGLQQELGPEFASSIVLISAVSGGSMGAMYYVDAFTEDGPPTTLQLEAIVTAAAHPSLAPVAWGLVYPDLWRLVWWLPILRNHRLTDRGWALETTWAQQLDVVAAARNETSPGSTRIGQNGDSGQASVRTLGQWQTGVEEGWRPAVIFNATTVETGERFLFASFDVPCDWKTKTFHRFYAGYDVPVTVAARMSATFPYVTPAARADVPRNWSAAPGSVACPYDENVDSSSNVSTDNPHLADGGYFDNDGVVSGLEWLESVWLDSERQNRDPNLDTNRLLIVQIPASPVDGGATSATKKRAERTRRGWLYSVGGPLITLLNVRSATQLERGQAEIRRFIEFYNSRNIQVVHCVFDLRAPGMSVLSWQLSSAEELGIRDAWGNEINAENKANDGRIRQIRRFLEGGPPTECKRAESGSSE